MEDKKIKIQIGVFWLCNFDIIYDSQDIQVNENTIDLVVYEKQHKDVWNELSKSQCSGRYSKFKYDFFPRGRVIYNGELKKYQIIMSNGSRLPENLKQKIINLVTKI